MRISIDTYPGLLSVAFSCCCDQNKVTKDILIIWKMALNNPSFTTLLSNTSQQCTLLVHISFTCKKKICMKQAIKYFEGSTCTLYTRFQCYVHRRHLRSSFDMPSFDRLCNLAHIKMLTQRTLLRSNSIFGHNRWIYLTSN